MFFNGGEGGYYRQNTEVLTHLGHYVLGAYGFSSLPSGSFLLEPIKIPLEGRDTKSESNEVFEPRAIQTRMRNIFRDCFVALLLAMTTISKYMTKKCSVICFSELQGH